MPVGAGWLSVQSTGVGRGPWALVVELSVVCPWVCFGKSSQIYTPNCNNVAIEMEWKIKKAK